MSRVLIAAALLAGSLAAQRLLLTPEDFDRIDRLTASAPWAASARDAIVAAARAWPGAHNQRYGLSEWQLPPEGGQWTLWYVCPRHGVYLQYRGPGQNICPVDSENYTGWPYDQVIYARRHSESANAARDAALAWRFTSNPAFLDWAARILLAYADVYSSYPLHDKDGGTKTSGARASAQTLDEAGWLIPLAWAYDLIAGSLDSSERTHIEQDLLRAAVAVITRNNAGKSNWQSWHNAAIGAVGFALNDHALIDRALDDPKNGFRFQMRESVFGDGVWYEGAWGYHFYALEPIMLLAEMAARAGIDLYAEPALRRMYEAPLKFAQPDGAMPAFNDSGVVNLFSYARLYEAAWNRYGDPLFASIAARRARGREALFWGAESLPDADPPAVPSAVFPDSGYAILRAAGSDNYAAIKFGPHGGGHGHYDKLNFIFYARGGVLGVDPGTQSYAAPTHNTWDKVTVAHNTVVVDERTQAEATGRLLAFASTPAISAVRADAGPAYKTAALERALVLTPEYLLDSFGVRSLDGTGHQFDWVYHNNGQAAPLDGVPYSAFPNSNGYQHLSDARAVDALQFDFDANDPLAKYGSTYVNQSAIGATFQYSREQAASGNFSGRMGYDFTTAQGYILFSTPTLSGMPQEVPASLSVWINGDGSGHKLALRLYDATDERFVYSVGPVDWTGWRQITAADPARWTHYLGNADGIFDPPVKSVAVELTSIPAGPVSGALFIDDIELDGRKVADFERVLRSLRLTLESRPDTTVVVGDGLGPDLLKPVPFVMARRRAAETQFHALLEVGPASAGRVTWNDDGSVEVTAADFQDRILFDSALRFVRRDASGALVRLALAGAAALGDLLQLDSPGAIQVDYSGDGAALDIWAPDLTGAVRVFAPAAQQITMNGSPAEFTREGDYCIAGAAGAAAAMTARSK